MTRDTNKNSRLPYIEPTIRTIAGFFITTIGVLLYTYNDHRLLWLSMLLFISLNLFQSGFSRWCLMEIILKRFGLRSELDEIRTLSRHLRESAARQAGHMDTLNLLSEAVLELSPDGLILNASDGWRRLSRRSPAPGEASQTPLLDYVMTDDAAIVTHMLKEITGSGKRVLRVRFRLAGGSREERWVEGRFMLDRHNAGNVRIKGVLRDVTETQRKERQIHRMAMHDALTGLPNRTLLENRMNQAMAHARRYDLHVGILFIDLDNFKQVNDTHGHQYGDRLLIRVSHILGNKLRASDTLARWGGDEFVVLLPDLTDPAGGMRTVATNLMLALDNELRGEGVESAITLSIGAASYPQDADNAAALLSLADKALYFAKSQGRNNVQVYNSLREAHPHLAEADISARFCSIDRAPHQQKNHQPVSCADKRRRESNG
ncbi:MAG TPA: diguanylate cyclase [Gammaproteobacteria bacterium]|nr:diguanylate cyclase [Gammaproteobacteria bacterium]